MDELIPIGRFAALTSLSTKALRLYHDQELLVPASVDPDSGYLRWSVDAQGQYRGGPRIKSAVCPNCGFENQASSGACRKCHAPLPPS